MVPWWKRLFYGLVGWVVATCTAALLALIWLLAQAPHKRNDSLSDVVSGVFSALLALLISAFAVTFFGWLLGLPYVLLVRNCIGQRFWAYLALGSGIGPVLVLFAVLTRTDSLSLTTDDYGTFCSSAVVSILTTLTYLLLLRRAQLVRK
jgi:hypothetical protein